jgi:hypothetical protein
MNEYNFEKREDWEKPRKITGMEAWRKITPAEMTTYLKAAKFASVNIDFTETETDKLCVWCPPDQDMELFGDKLNELKKQKKG